ncbi:Carboxylesterase [Aspergillus venezuelensis]
MILTVTLATLTLLSTAILAQNPTVTISSGTVIGTTFCATNAPQISTTANVFLGIPFASSPPQRFSPPEPPQPWPTPLTAQVPPPGCIEKKSSDAKRQLLGSSTLSDTDPSVPQSEDCLYLNVYAPQDASPDNLKSVMFWIYGGNLEYGNSSYNGTSLAIHEDIVFVSFNYRLNIYGFPNEPGVELGLANVGFLDQRLALDWVQKNIIQFGGDPARITIFGESAGGYSVKQLLATPPSPLPYRAAIIESQQRILPGNGTDNFINAMAHFNCDNTECLRQVPVQELTDYIKNQSFFFAPVYDNITCVSNVESTIESGQFANVPLLMGTNRNELSSLVYNLSSNGTSTTSDTLVALFQAAGASHWRALAATDTIKDDIEKNLLGRESTLVDLSRIFTDLAFTCPSGEIVNETASRFLPGTSPAPAPIWRYRFSTSVNINTLPGEGAVHASEIPFVFGAGYPCNQTLEELSQYMHPLWASFGKDPYAGPGWDVIHSEDGGSDAVGGSVLGDIGDNGFPGKQDVSIADVDEYCPYLVDLAAKYSWVYDIRWLWG